MSEEQATVFVVDDDASMRKSLSRLLRSAGHTVETFASAREFLASEFQRQDPSCIVLDMRMPGLDGLDLQEELLSRDYALPIVFITGHGDVPSSVSAMKKGAVDFLEKPCDDAELLRAVKVALQKDSQARARLMEIEDIRQRLATLTPREREVLTYVISGMLNKQIAYALNITEKTVIVHRGRVMEKMAVGSVAELVQLSSKAGIQPAKNPN
jgi:FixJ family two-component response regulator